MDKYKCILSLRVARGLIAKDYRLVDIQPSHKRLGKLVFVFENSEQLEKDLSEYRIGSR